jgi:hypothetical protein
MLQRSSSRTILVAALLAMLTLLTACDAEESAVTTPRTVTTSREPDTTATTVPDATATTVPVATATTVPDATATVFEATSTAIVNGTNQTQTAVPTHRLPSPVELVLQDLAQQLEIAPNSIDVLRIEDVVWPDGCLGLPAPELCAPFETPGYRVTLHALGREYQYHTNRDSAFRYAGPGEAP